MLRKLIHMEYEQTVASTETRQRIVTIADKLGWLFVANELLIR